MRKNRLVSLVCVFVMILSFCSSVWVQGEAETFFEPLSQNLNILLQTVDSHQLRWSSQNQNQAPFGNLTEENGKFTLTPEKSALYAEYLTELDSYFTAISYNEYENREKTDNESHIMLQMKNLSNEDYLTLDIDGNYFSVEVSFASEQYTLDGIKNFFFKYAKITDYQAFISVITKIAENIYEVYPQIVEKTIEEVLIKNWNYTNKTFDVEVSDSYKTHSYIETEKIEFDVDLSNSFNYSSTFFEEIINKNTTIHCIMNVYAYGSQSINVLTLKGDKNTVSLFTRNNFLNSGIQGLRNDLSFPISQMQMGDVWAFISTPYTSSIDLEGRLSTNSNQLDITLSYGSNSKKITANNIESEVFDRETFPSVPRYSDVWLNNIDKEETENSSSISNDEGLNFATTGSFTTMSYKYNNNGTETTLNFRPSQMGKDAVNQITEALTDLKISEKSENIVMANTSNYILKIEFMHNKDTKDVTIVKLFDKFIHIQRDEVWGDPKFFDYGSSGLKEKLIAIAEDLKNLNTEEKEETKTDLVTTDLRKSSAERRWAVDVDYAATADISLASEKEWYKKLGENVTVSVVSMVRILNETEVFPEPMIKLSGEGGTKWFSLSMIEYQRPTGESTKLPDDKTVYAAFSELESFKNFVTVRKESGYDKLEMYLNFTDETKQELESIRFISGEAETIIPIDNFNYIGGTNTYEKWYK